MTVEHLLTAFLENLEKSGLILRVDILVELGVGEEVLPVHPMVSRVRQRERPNVEAGLSGEHATTHPWLVLIERRQLDPGVRILPKAAEHAHHVAARYSIYRISLS